VKKKTFHRTEMKEDLKNDNINSKENREKSLKYGNIVNYVMIKMQQKIVEQWPEKRLSELSHFVIAVKENRFYVYRVSMKSINPAMNQN